MLVPWTQNGYDLDMSRTRFESAEVAEDNEVRGAWARFVLTAHAMGLIEEVAPAIDHPDLEGLRALGDRLAHEGIGQAVPLTAGDRTAFLDTIGRLHQALEDSPLPSRELPALLEVLGPELLSRLLSVSESSIRRYAAGERTPPDDIANRAHLLSGVVGDLRGGYNEFGVRRWFDRRRELLKGMSPVELLEGDWDPEGDDAKRVRDLSRWLTHSPAT